MNNIVTNICYIHYTLFIHLLMIMIKYCLHTWNSNYQHEHWLLIFLASWGARPSLTPLPQADPISLRSQAKPRSHVGHNNILFIDGHVYWDSNCWLPFIFCWPRKKTSIFCFHLHQTNGSLLFPFYICSKHTEVAVFCSSHFPYKYINICKEKWHHIYITIRYQWDHCSLCKWKFVVCLFVNKETNQSYPFANGLNRLNRLAHLWIYQSRALEMMKR
jgi:prepilin-type processing-associated H-X9-DG protein